MPINLDLIRRRAFDRSNVVIPALGTSDDRVSNVATWIDAAAQSYNPPHDNLEADRDAICDVLRRMKEAEGDRVELLAEVDRLNRIIKERTKCFDRWYQGNQ